MEATVRRSNFSRITSSRSNFSGRDGAVKIARHHKCSGLPPDTGALVILLQCRAVAALLVCTNRHYASSPPLWEIAKQIAK